MNIKDFNLLIVGYGAIGKLVSNISNANLGDKNPGVEILSLSYHIPY